MVNNSKGKGKGKENGKVDGYQVLSKLLDVKLFGGMVPDEAKVIGAIQCEWATSLHPVQIETVTITSAFSSSENKGQGSMGKKHFIPYGLYGSGWIYSANRREEFKKLANQEININDMELFEEALINGSSHSRTSVKGFIEPVLIVKVIKDEKLRSRFDALAEEIEVEIFTDRVMNSKDIKIKLNSLKKALECKDYKKVQVYVSPNAERRYKELKTFKRGFSELKIEEDDLNVSWEYIVVYEVKHSNPNGDPDMDNMPRRWEGTDIGIISPERQKRWIRDYLEDKGELIFVTRRGKVQKARDRMKEIEDMI